jgi:hypothetical protein
LYSFPNIIRQDQIRENEVGGTCGQQREVYRVLVGKPKEIDHWEDHGEDGRMGSEWILVRLAGR